MSKTLTIYIIEELNQLANLAEEIANYHIEESHQDFQIMKDAVESARDLIRCGWCQETDINKCTYLHRRF